MVEGTLRKGGRVAAGEHGLDWRRSSRCDSGACLEVARVAGGVLVRNPDDPQAGPLTFSAAAWAGFIADVRKGRFARS